VFQYSSPQDSIWGLIWWGCELAVIYAERKLSQREGKVRASPTSFGHVLRRFIISAQ
jgi:hypothetical protein